MKRFFTGILTLLITFTGVSQTQDISDKLIPLPVSVEVKDGNFSLTDETAISYAGEDAGVKRVAENLATALKATGNSYTPVKKSSQTTGGISFSLINNSTIGDEGYQLNIDESKVTIEANKPAGLFYGMQTLLQLLPKEIAGKDVAKNVSWKIPACSITDYPRFGWRGLMFDVSRHFFGKDDVKRFIDEMARYKYNLLHLTLSNDEGWRIEIKGLPRLTEVGAWNVKKVGYFGTFEKPGDDEPRDYGGFYTQDDIREIVKYAGDHFVNVLPEIDVPGHSLAAVVSYPELSCTDGVDKYQVRSGEQIMDWSHGHPPIAMVDNTLCPANEKVYDFMDKVMTQVAALFPFEYIHVGGDECPKNFWEKSPEVKALMKKENLKTMDEVQSYFEKRLEKIVTSKGKKFMGWDEILQGGLGPSAAVMSWRGMKGGIEAAKMKHDVVMTPTDFVYLDYMQGDAAIEPRVYSTLRLKKTYQFEPVPDGVDPKYILGGQGNLWTEQVYTYRHAQYMLWPRAFAISEALWSPKSKRNWNNFFTRVENHFERLDEAQIKYAPSVYEPVFTISKSGKDDVQIDMGTEPEGIDIYYTVDNTFPDNFSPKYTKAFVMPKEAAMLKVITYKGDKPVGRMIYIPMEDLRKRAGLK